MQIDDIHPPTEVTIGGKRYLTYPVGFAAELGRCVRTVARWHTQRIGPPIIHMGSARLVDPDDLPAWLDSLKRQPTRRRR